MAAMGNRSDLNLPRVCLSECEISLARTVEAHSRALANGARF
jgi:hypothetical protein